MDELKIRLVKIAVCVIAAAGQHRVGEAVCQQGFQPHGEIQVIQIFQEAVLPGVAQFFQVIGQIVLRNHLAHGTDLLHEGDAGFSPHLKAVAEAIAITPYQKRRAYSKRSPRTNDIILIFLI